MAIARKKLTLADFLRLPEEKPALEYWQGAVSQKMSPKGPHFSLQAELIVRFNGFAVPRRLGRAFPEARITFGGFSLVPDVVVYRWDRIPSDRNGDIPADVVDPPDIAVEIASPGQTRRELVERCRWYVENGVSVAVLIQPRDRSVRAFRPGQDSGLLRGADQLHLDDVIPGFALTVDDLFSALRARPE